MWEACDFSVRDMIDTYQPFSSLLNQVIGNFMHIITQLHVIPPSFGEFEEPINLHVWVATEKSFKMLHVY